MTVMWSLSIIATALLTMAFYPALSQTGIGQIVNSVPSSLQSLIGSAQSFKTIPGYIDQQIYGPNMLILIIAFAVILFISLSVTDEDRGTLQTLLTMPISRQRVYIDKLLAGLTILGIACLCIAIGTFLGLAMIHDHASAPRLLESTFVCWLLSACYGVIAFSIGTAIGKRGITIALASIYAFGSFIISSLAPAVKALHTIDKFSLLHYYNTKPVMEHGIYWGSDIVFIIVSLALIIVSIVIFQRRDINMS